MLNKIRNTGGNSPLRVDTEAGLTQPLYQHFAGGLSRLQRRAGGTMSYCYTANLFGQDRFFKTHLPDRQTHTLALEADLLRITSGDRADAQLLSLCSPGPPRLWLHMKLLQATARLMPQDIQELTRLNHIALNKSGEVLPVPPTDTFFLLLRESHIALARLATEHLISPKTHALSRLALETLDTHSPSWTLGICHGDLSPNNIMADHQGNIAIDWEDVFWGPTGYDYLYWLTFIANRTHLSRTALGVTPLGHASEIALMVMIVILKSFLSFRNKTHHNNHLTVDHRLSELFTLA